MTSPAASSPRISSLKKSYVPDCESGPARVSGTSLKLPAGGMSFQLLILESGPQMAFSCAVVSSSEPTSVFALVTMVIPSEATRNSWYSTPPLLQAATSSSSIAREASEMSVSPLQNSSKPPPVPDVPTVMLTSPFSALNASAAAEVRGPTVEEPSMAMSPESEAASPPEVGGAGVVVVTAARGGERAHGEHRRGGDQGQTACTCHAWVLSSEVGALPAGGHPGMTARR